jgi:hypothetical protein
MADKVTAAVITEWHPFDVMNFQRLFWRFEDVEAYPQAWDIFAKDVNRDSYQRCRLLQHELSRTA